MSRNFEQIMKSPEEEGWSRRCDFYDPDGGTTGTTFLSIGVSSPGETLYVTDLVCYSSFLSTVSLLKGTVSTGTSILFKARAGDSVLRICKNFKTPLKVPSGTGCSLLSTYAVGEVFTLFFGGYKVK